MSQTSFPRERLIANAADIIRALPGIGRIMINTRWGGATHERMGVVEHVAEDAGWMVCTGAEHDSRIDVSQIASVIVDRTSIMGGQAYPRVDFLLADESVLCSVIGFAGLEPFDAVMQAFGPGEELEPAERTAPSGAATETDPADPGTDAFNRALANAETVTVRINRPGFTQQWIGIVEKVSPSRGFINVMRTDFHLHLRAEAVAGWQTEQHRDETVLVALNSDQQPTGLTVHGSASALAPAKTVETV